MTENRISKENCVEMFTEKWGNRYDYSKVTYIDSRTPVTIGCREHGEFQILARNHVKGYTCPECERIEYQGKCSLMNHLMKGLVLSSEIPLSYVAVDFEILNKGMPLSACSIGLVKYVDGQITDRMYSYIRPLFDRIEGGKPVPANSNGGITKEDVQEAPTLADLMPSIEDFVGDLPLVAHHATMERNCFQSNFEHWGIQTKRSFIHFLDTEYISDDIEKIYGNGKVFKGTDTHTLTTVCYRLGLPALEHHHAEKDAEMCGNVLLCLARIQRGVIAPVFKEGFPPSENTPRKQQPKIKKYDKSIVATISENQIPENPFKGKKVVLTRFSVPAHNLYKQKLLNLGALVPGSVSGKTDILLYGSEEGKTKYEEAVKRGKQLMSEEEFLSIIKAYE